MGQKGQNTMKLSDRILLPFRPAQRFLTSLFAFLILSMNGFRITTGKSKYVKLKIYRFWWKGKTIRDMCDIDQVDTHTFVTMHNGRHERLK